MNFVVFDATPPIASGWRPRQFRRDIVTQNAWLRNLPVWPRLLAEMGVAQRIVATRGCRSPGPLVGACWIEPLAPIVAAVQHHDLHPEETARFTAALATGKTLFIRAEHPVTHGRNDVLSQGFQVAVNEDGTRGAILSNYWTPVTVAQSPSAPREQPRGASLSYTNLTTLNS